MLARKRDTGPSEIGRSTARKGHKRPIRASSEGAKENEHGVGLDNALALLLVVLADDYAVHRRLPRATLESSTGSEPIT